MSEKTVTSAGTKAFLEKLESKLADCLPAADCTHPLLREAMAYSLLGGGKRLRPQLLAAVARLGDHDEEAVLLASASIEILHAYSLIHDDLPAMDDDDWRRGRPACHKVYGEAMAILAGDALQALSFRTLSSALERARLTGKQILAAIADFSQAAGPEALVGGQAGDLETPPVENPGERLMWIHERKTAALISCSLTLGARIARLPVKERQALGRAGALLGLAFQTVDDILDDSSSREQMGKTPGKDKTLGKLTMLTHYGAEEAARKAEDYLREALVLIPDRPEASTLRELAHRLVRRRS